MPARQLCDGLLTPRTVAVWRPPKIQEAPPSLQGIRHLHAQAGFEVACPCWVRRVRGGVDFAVPGDRRIGPSPQPGFPGFAVARDGRARENPAVVGHAGARLTAKPSGRLVRMSTLGPTPQGLEDGLVPLGTDHFTHHVAVLVGPAAPPRLQLANPLTRRGRLVDLDALPSLPEERGNALARGLDAPLAVVLADVLPEEITPLVDRCDHGLVGSQPQPALRETVCDQRLDLLCEDFFGARRDAPLVTLAPQIHRRVGPALGLGEAFSSFPLQAVPRQIGQDGRRA